MLSVRRYYYEILLLRYVRTFARPPGPRIGWVEEGGRHPGRLAPPPPPLHVLPFPFSTTILTPPVEKVLNFQAFSLIFLPSTLGFLFLSLPLDESGFCLLHIASIVRYKV